MAKASVAARGSAGPPEPLRRTIETCVALARGGVANHDAALAEGR